MTTAYHIDTPGKTIFGFPINRNVEDWDDYVVEFIEGGLNLGSSSSSSSDDYDLGPGVYVGLLDTSISSIWLIFDAVPATADDHKATWVNPTVTANLTPIFLSQRNRTVSNQLIVYVNETHDEQLTLFDAEGQPLDLSGRTLVMRFVDSDQNLLSEIPDNQLIISGDNNNQLTFTWPSAITNEFRRDLVWSIRDLSDGNFRIQSGRVDMRYSP